MDSVRMSVPEAAKMLSMGNDGLMAWLRSNRPPPFGAYVKEDGKRQGRYIIYRSRVAAYLAAADMNGSPKESA